MWKDSLMREFRQIVINSLSNIINPCDNDNKNDKTTTID